MTPNINSTTGSLVKNGLADYERRTIVLVLLCERVSIEQVLYTYMYNTKWFLGDGWEWDGFRRCR